MSFLLNPFIYSSAPTPPVSSGLVGWYIGNTGVITSSGAVDTWQDQSSTGNHLTQTNNTAHRPTHNTDRLTFDGTNDYLTGTTNVSIGHIFIVMTPSGLQQYGQLIGTTTLHSFMRWDNIQGIQKMYYDGGTIYGAATFAANSRVALAPSVMLNQAKAVFSVKGTAATNQKLLLGKDINGGSPASGDIYEILIYSSSLSDTDRNTVENYLKNKYSL